MGCNTRSPKKELLRVVRTPENVVLLDFTGKKSGRGAYLCRSLKCLKQARKTRRIERVLECAISEEVYNDMEKEMEANEP